MSLYSSWKPSILLPSNFKQANSMSISPPPLPLCFNVTSGTMAFTINGVIIPISACGSSIGIQFPLEFQHTSVRGQSRLEHTVNISNARNLSSPLPLL